MITYFKRTLSLGSMSLLALAGMAPLAVLADEAAPQNVNVALVDTLTALAHGPYPGLRSNHAKGVMATGYFVGSAQAPGLTMAANASGAKVPVLVRFSNTSGLPASIDGDGGSSPHGIAIRFMLPNDTTTDIVSISFNGFPVATPEDFLGLLTAIKNSGPGAAKPSPIETFLGAHPAALKFVVAPKPAPSSFTTLAFYGVNAFQFTNAQGVSRFGRYRIIPVKPEPALSAEQASAMSPDYLMNELPQRLAHGPAQFKISVQLAEAGDVINDGTIVWPDARTQVELGILTLDAIVADSKAEEKKIMFNPLSLPDGIAPSADPILLARPIAYAVSYARRVGQ